MRGVGKNKTHLPANHIKGNGLFAGAEGVAHTRRFQLELRSSGSKKKDVLVLVRTVRSIETVE